MSDCPICNSQDLDTVYSGPIRMGRFGDVSEETFDIRHCQNCDSAWLGGKFFDYMENDYRKRYDGEETIDRYHELHDDEQSRPLQFLRLSSLRDALIADIGCGGGSFLDVTKGLARDTVAIEPARFYHSGLISKGHRVYDSTETALQDYAGRLDLAVCLSVVEHVDQPVDLLRQIRGLLAPGGRALISTPNRADWLLDLLPESYGAFFYRSAHRWYFTEPSLKVIAERAGFDAARCVVHGYQRYGLGNFLMWMRDRKPTGEALTGVPTALNETFRNTLAVEGKADYLWMMLETPEGKEGLAS